MFRSVAITLALSLATVTAQAALLSRLSGQAYYDDVLDITWLANNSAGAGSIYDDGTSTTDGAMTWNSAQAWIGSLNTSGYLGVSDWRLPLTLQPDPTCLGQFDPGGGFPMQGSGVFCTGSEMGHLYNVEGIISPFAPGPFTNLGLLYWSGTEYAPNTNSAWYFDFDFGSQLTTPKNSAFSAWAVRPGDIAPVPISPAAWLFGSALGLMGWMRRKVSI